MCIDYVDSRRITETRPHMNIVWNNFSTCATHENVMAHVCQCQVGIYVIITWCTMSLDHWDAIRVVLYVLRMCSARSVAKKWSHATTGKLKWLKLWPLASDKDNGCGSWVCVCVPQTSTTHSCSCTRSTLQSTFILQLLPLTFASVNVHTKYDALQAILTRYTHDDDE